ncbi:MAG TPA: EAL domain-containing protein [Pyrinomonadaceae bacterium]|jgi:diguanylate cyclase (GGDEF)-like protein/PAS domain S-box-containing protein|nr:EAL domain-containing protein [Pyrinomonadaceae bacterium]
MYSKVDAALRHLVATNLVAIVFTDLAGNILNADESFLNLLGYAAHNLPRSIHELTPPEHHRLDEEAFEKLMAFGACAPFEKDLLKQDGTPVPVLFGAALHEEEIACFVVDLSQNKQKQEKLNHLAYHDALTDLPNQVLFKDRLKQAIALSRRSDQLQAVLLLNLDRFKTINDSLGYTAGDRLLQSMAQRLTSCVRESDTVARFGGDEFAILLTQIPRAQDAANVARAIKQTLDQAFLFEDQEIFVSSSIGISLYPHDGRDTAGLLKTAGAALDRAKVQGGNNFQFYTAGGTTRALKQLVLESNLRPGLERLEFVVQYQPQVDVRSCQLVGMEALVRWQHPSLGLLYPNEFVPLAEESGLILSLGDWVMRTACAQNKSWQDAGLTPMRLSVNFSARQFQQPTFITDVAQILKDTNLDPRWLELELTESSIMKDPEEAIEKLHELKLMGIKVAIDDFGTGYSSLNYLKRFPIDTLKIDKSFVSDVCKDPHDTAIVRAIINLGHALELMVIAEGVETKEQLQYLTALECDAVQGFLFSKALPASGFEELLVEQKRVAMPSTVLAAN